MDALEKYIRLREDLRRIREVNDNQESTEEDTLLDKMDEVWRQLSPEDVKSLNVSNRVEHQS